MGPLDWEDPGWVWCNTAWKFAVYKREVRRDSSLLNRKARSGVLQVKVDGGNIVGA